MNHIIKAHCNGCKKMVEMMIKQGFTSAQIGGQKKCKSVWTWHVQCYYCETCGSTYEREHKPY